MLHTFMNKFCGHPMFRTYNAPVTGALGLRRAPKYQPQLIPDSQLARGLARRGDPSFLTGDGPSEARS